MKFFADFHIHSRYARNTHPDMEIPTIVRWAKMKGLALLGTGDFTHPQWLVELKKFLKPTSGRGVYEYEDVRFVLTTEVACVYTRGGRTFKVHHLLFAPNFSTADRLRDALARFGDLDTEARPTVSLTAEDLVKAASDVSPDVLVAPAHAWGPQQALFSEQFGYDRFDDAYGSQAARVRVLETGLCCDPARARRWRQVDGRTLISNSDAHHPSHIGREANIFDCPMDYRDITAALLKNDRARFLGTVEAFAEEDRFYGSGHRGCAAGPARNGRSGRECPSCGKPVTAGVAHRIESLADRAAPPDGTEPFSRIVPLQDVIAEALGFQPEAETVQRQHLQIVTQVGPELDILLNWPEDRLRERLPLRVAEGVLALRRGDVTVEPGYDGLPGRVRVRLPEGIPQDPGQLKLF